LRFLEQCFREADASGIADSNDLRFHMNLLMGLHCNHILMRKQTWWPVSEKLAME